MLIIQHMRMCFLFLLFVPLAANADGCSTTDRGECIDERGCYWNLRVIAYHYPREIGRQFNKSYIS